MTSGSQQQSLRQAQHAATAVRTKAKARRLLERLALRLLAVMNEDAHERVIALFDDLDDLLIRAVRQAIKVDLREHLLLILGGSGGVELARRGVRRGRGLFATLLVILCRRRRRLRSGRCTFWSHASTLRSESSQEVSLSRRSEL
jgi:hypothetical protein